MPVMSARGLTSEVWRIVQQHRRVGSAAVASSLTLVVALVLLGATAARLAAAVRLRSPTTFLVGAFVIAHAELLLIALVLSLFRAFTATSAFAFIAVVAVVVSALTRGRRSGIDWRSLVRALTTDRVLVVLAVVAALGAAYSLAMGLWVPQVEDDALTYHLVRAGLWRQHHGITYLSGILDLRNNAYPPGGELGPFATMTLAGNDSFVALDQWLAMLAVAVATCGIARRIGFGRREAFFGGALMLTLPIVELQAGAAMSDLLVGAFLICAMLLVLDGARAAPWLAGVATGLAIDVKQSAPIGVPILILGAVFARPPSRRLLRIGCVLGGAVLGAYWYVVNLVETGTLDGHVSEEFHVDRSPVSVVARAVRTAILFFDMSGANGRDRWLYLVASLVVLAIAGVFFVRARRRTLLLTGAVAAVVAAVPLLVVPVERGAIRAYFKFWDLAGRRDLAALDSGRDITKSASNFSWFGPLGSLLFAAAAVLTVIAYRRGRLRGTALLCIVAPAYWVAAVALLLSYQDWLGRFFVFPLGLAAATWGILLRWRPVAWGVTAIAATTLLLASANDAKRPSGLPLLERAKPRSVWHTPRWTGVALRDDYDTPIRFLDHRIPHNANVGLAITTSDPVYPFFGRELDRRVSFVRPEDRDAPGARWVFVRPGLDTSLCPAWKTVVRTPDGWLILRRQTSTRCA